MPIRNTPFLIFADKGGKIYSHPYLKMAVSNLDRFSLPSQSDLIRLPNGSTVFYLPGRNPVGFNEETNSFEVLDEFHGKKVFAACAFLIPAYLRLSLPAFVIRKDEKLPFWAYAACGFLKGEFYTAAMRIDKRVRQSPYFYENKILNKNIEEFLDSYPGNRLYRHLANCAVNYNCLAAKNLFYRRWEAPLPTARFCNASCLGCLSLQDEQCLSSHKRISFQPSVEEISQVMVNHLRTARGAIVSFGQGCEGEPLLEAKNISRAITATRRITGRGTVNMNTNASLPASIEVLCKAGIDSLRVSLNSPEEEFYNLYFRPRNYKFRDVVESIQIAKKHKKFISLNLFIFPGFSDCHFQIKSLVSFIRANRIDMLQCRNLNIDQQFYLSHILRGGNFKPLGMKFFIYTLSREFPKLKIGYFNLPKESFTGFKNVVK